MDTGEDTNTGGRLKRVARYVMNEDTFCFTYGDGVSNVDITAAITFHQQHGKLATLTAVVPPGRYGAITRDGNRITSFMEKPPGDGGLINGGFFVLSPKVLDWIEGDDSGWEGHSLTKLAAAGEMMAFEHTGFWQPMDTLRDKTHLEDLWQSGKAPWKIW
ncbi:MAG: sugar phosphate nucleotidyltransferase [Methylococcaceae bacterium]